MNADELLRHYERFADASDAIPRLRRFIFDLGVRGKLVPQDPTDAPSNALLTEIEAMRSELAIAGNASKQRASLDITDGPFDLPTSWVWARLGQLTSYIQRGKSPKYADVGGSPVVSQKCVQWTGLDLRVARMVTIESLANYEEIRFLRDGDLLWNSTGTGTIGRVIRLVQPPNRLVCDSHVTVVRCLGVHPEYIRTWLRSDAVYGSIEGRAAGSTNQVELTAQMASSQAVPLPPLAEQLRIVAKVDELMALCDRLEAARAERETARDRLTAATLARLTAPDPETFREYAHVALQVLPEISARPQLVDQLRQTILTMAVQGKLTASPGARNASARIGGEASAEQLPSHWRWARAEEICEAIVDCPHSTPVFVPSGVVCLDTNAFKGGAIISATVRYVTEESYYERVRRLAPQPGDIIFAREGSVGESVIVPDGMRCCLGQRVMLFRPSEQVDSRYFQLALSEPDSLIRLLALHKGIGAKHVNVADMRKASIPLPPLTEQRAIVATVAELTALCAGLASRLAQTESIRRQLLEALLLDVVARRQSTEEALS